MFRVANNDFDRNIARKFYKLIQGFRRARKYLKKNKIKIVHTNDIRNHYSWAIWSLFLTTHIWHQRTVWPKSIQFYFFYFLQIKFFVIQDICLIKQNLNI